MFLFHRSDINEKLQHGLENDITTTTSSNRKIKTSKRKKHRVMTWDDSDEESESVGNPASKETAQSNRENGRASSGGSDIDDEKEGVDDQNGTTGDAYTVLNEKQLRQLHDNDNGDLGNGGNVTDSDGDVENNNRSKDALEVGRKRPRDDMDGSEEDDDEEFNVPLSYHKKAKRVFIDDDDDDDNI